MSTANTQSLVSLPKAHLHVPLEGAMRPTTLAELAERYGVEVPAPPSRFGGFQDFLSLYRTACGVIRTLDDLQRVMREVVEDAHADGAVWVEPAVHVPNYDDLGPDELVLDALLDAARSAATATGTGVGLIVALDRTLPPEVELDQARLARRHANDGVVALGLASDETAAPPEQFEAAFRLAREAGLLRTPHAGEHVGPQSVRGALDTLGADRVQHGVRAVEDRDLVSRLADQGVCLDVALTSNAALGVVTDSAEHPLPRLLAAGVACSVNADDPLLFGSGLADEYRLCREVLGLDDVALAECARASVLHSGAPEQLKRAADAAIDRWLDGPSQRGGTCWSWSQGS